MVNRTGNIVYLAVISVIAIIAVALLAFNNGNGLQGAATHTQRVDSFEPLCIDTDPQNNYDRFGFVQLNSIQYLDYCNDNTLFQRYCKTGSIIGVTHGYRCPGECVNGVCV